MSARNGETLLPAFPVRNIAVALAADDRYAALLGVTIASVLAHAAPGDNYDVIVLDDGIVPASRRRLRSLMRENASLRFVDMRGYLAGKTLPDFHVSHYINVATYYRFFLPELMAGYDRVLYLDCDLVTRADMADLFRIDLGENLLAAAWDMYMAYNTNQGDAEGEKLRTYLAGTLRLPAPGDYFQAGVLVMNLEAMRRTGFTRHCLERLQEIGKPLYWDQCVLNSVCHGRVRRLGLIWNFLWETGYRLADFRGGLPAGRREEYLAARDNPKIVHYCSGIKAWTKVDAWQSDWFWEAARPTPFYRDLLGRFLEQEMVRALGNTAGLAQSAWPAALKAEAAP